MEKLLKVEQLSEIIQVSPSTIYHWTQADFIPHYKFPKGIRFRLSDIDNWLKRRKHNGRERLSIGFDI